MEAVKARRLDLGLSADQAARQAGVSTSMWVKVERGERMPSLRIARKIATALQCSLDDIFLPSNYPESVNKDEHAAAAETA